MQDHDDVVGYHFAFNRMMCLLRDGVSRESGTMQFKIQKFLECSHFLLDHLFKGPPIANSTDTGERGLKTWAKSPATTAQNRSDGIFKKQVANNYHQSYLLQQLTMATKHVSPVTNPGETTNSVDAGKVSVYGRNYVYVFHSSGSGLYYTKQARKPDLGDSIMDFLPQCVEDWFKSNLGLWYRRQILSATENDNYRLIIPIYTELMIESDIGEESTTRCSRLRAHPNYRREGPWYDYISVKYHFEGSDQGLYPARLACFFSIPNEIPLDEVRFCLVSPGSHNEVFCLIQESCYQDNHQKSNVSKLCSTYTLQSIADQARGGKMAMISCINHLCIEGSIFVIDLVPLDNVQAEAGTLSHRDPFWCPSTPAHKCFDILVVDDRKTKWPLNFLSSVEGHTSGH
jgi:hypothetical protein